MVCNPKFSVIVPTFNRADAVQRAVESLLAQTYANLEILVIDDGSTDATAQVLQPYRDRIRYFYQKNGGVCAARNAGLRLATGAWVGFLDSDDEWTPRKLTAHVEAIRSNPEIIAHIVNASIEFPGRAALDYFKTRHFRVKPNGMATKAALPWVAGHGLWSLIPCVVSRETVQKVGWFDETLSLHEDLDFLLRVATIGPWGASPEVAAKFVRREEPEHLSLTGRAFGKVREDEEQMLKVLERFRTTHNLNGSCRRAINRRMGECYFRLALHYREQRPRREFRISLRQSLAHNVTLRHIFKCLLISLPANNGLRLYRRWSGMEPICRN